MVWEGCRLAFERLQQRLGRRGAAAALGGREWPAHYVACGLVHAGGGLGLTGMPHTRRPSEMETLSRTTLNAVSVIALSAPFTASAGSEDRRCTRPLGRVRRISWS